MVITMKISINIEPHVGYSYDDIAPLAKAAEDTGHIQSRFQITEPAEKTLIHLLIVSPVKNISHYPYTCNSTGMMLGCFINSNPAKTKGVSSSASFL